MYRLYDSDCKLSIANGSCRIENVLQKLFRFLREVAGGRAPACSVSISPRLSYHMQTYNHVPLAAVSCETYLFVERRVFLAVHIWYDD
jgi:hypothetical protein